jgi:hypothetical protein
MPLLLNGICYHIFGNCWFKIFLKKLEEIERERARRRQEATWAPKGVKVGEHTKVVEILPPPLEEDKGKTRDKVAEKNRWPHTGQPRARKRPKNGLKTPR